MVVIGWISVALQIKGNCHSHFRPAQNPPLSGKSGLCLCHEDALQYITVFIPIHSALAHLKQLIWIGSLPSESLSLVTNKHDDNIASQAVVCYWAARWRWPCDSCIKNQCVVTWPTTKGVFEDTEDGKRNIKPRQMGWDNKHACDRLHQLIKEAAIYWRQKEILQNTKCYQIAVLCF